jgi:tetratricopeptide (TPR) repeat protein
MRPLIFFTGAPSNGDAFDLIRKGDILFSNGENVAAEEAFSDAIAADPANLLAYTKRAAVLLARGQATSAIRDYTKALELEPRSVPTLLSRGNVYLRYCKFDSAGDDFSAVLELKPGHDAALDAQEKLLSARSHLETAEVRYTGPHNSSALFALLLRSSKPLCVPFAWKRC